MPHLKKCAWNSGSISVQCCRPLCFDSITSSLTVNRIFYSFAICLNRMVTAMPGVLRIDNELFESIPATVYHLNSIRFLWLWHFIFAAALLCNFNLLSSIIHCARCFCTYQSQCGKQTVRIQIRK